MSLEQQTAADNHVCPWWMAYTFDNPVRKLFHQPPKILGPYVEKGMKVMDVGCGMGFFSIGMARMVGDDGKVYALDLQQKMLDVTVRRARRAGLGERIRPHRCGPEKLGLEARVGFILTFWMVHEVKNKKSFFSELRSNLAPGGKILIAEPRMHVAADAFQKTLETARSAGLQVCDHPAIRFSLTALLASG
jgi:ubiquinone/menaquinone biosynthesis C-methylase UbiE